MNQYLIAVALLSLGSFCQAQYIPVQPLKVEKPLSPSPWVPDYSRIPPEERKKERDLVLKQLPEAGPFTTRYGHVAVVALKKCSPEVGKRLLEAPWDRLQRPEALLDAVAKHGDVGAFIASRYEELLPKGAVDTFLRKPLDYSFDLARVENDNVPVVQLASSPSGLPDFSDTVLPHLSDWRIIVAMVFVLIFGVFIGCKLKRRIP